MIILPARLISKINTFTESHAELVCNYYILKMKKSIEQDDDMCILFRTPDSLYTLAVKKEFYVGFLESIIRISIKSELYEIATQSRQLIDHIEINNVIKSSIEYD